MEIPWGWYNRIQRDELALDLLSIDSLELGIICGIIFEQNANLGCR